MNDRQGSEIFFRSPVFFGLRFQTARPILEDMNDATSRQAEALAYIADGYIIEEFLESDGYSADDRSAVAYDRGGRGKSVHLSTVDALVKKGLVKCAGSADGITMWKVA